MPKHINTLKVQGSMLKAIAVIAVTIFSLPVQAAETIDYANYYGVKEIAVASVPEASPTTTTTSTETTVAAPTTTTAPDSLQELDYSQVKAPEGAEIQKGLEFAVKETSNTGNATEISVKNEYPESLKVVFETLGENIEIYLNAYELLDKVALNKSSEYKIRVYNIYNDYLGYIRSPATLVGQLKVSPFLLVRDSIVEAPTVKFVREEKPAPVQASPEAAPVTKPQENLTEKPAEKTEVKKEEAPQIANDVNPLSKRPIRVANISKTQIHIDIVEANNQAIGEGWTVANDIYEPQFLNLKSEPIQISADADLTVTQTTNQTTIKKKAKELNIDEKGNYVWLIDNLALSSSQ